MGHYTIEGQLINTPHNFINLLDGGDMTTNPFQRNIPGLASAGTITTPITSTPTYFADRWFMVGGASSSILASVIADASIAGFNQSLQMTRSSGNANTAALSLGQVLESADCVRCQGQELTFSFWARAAANYSGGPLTVQLVAGTGLNQSAASLVAGTWTGQANIINTTQTLTGTMTRYQFSGLVPSTATQLGVLLSWTPSGTAGAADGIILNGFQLEIGNLASPYEHRDVQVELEICQRYAWVIPEPGAGVIVGVGGAVASANNQVFYLATPVQLYKAPSVSVSAGSFKVAAAAAAAAATGLAAGSTHTPNAISLVSTLTETVGLAATLQGGGGSGYVIASADF
ncbi:MAG TPA: hypothetical protein VKW08_15065 [Xanthobacteraceae bacterium]|nr:hypothetical protein [Xanthobacteraceae bacterium]